MTEIDDRAIALIAAILETDSRQLTPDSVFIDIKGWDSLAHLQIIGEIEDRFKISIPIENIADIKTIKDITVYLK
jgi:acyl carrier protein